MGQKDISSFRVFLYLNTNLILKNENKEQDISGISFSMFLFLGS